MDSELESSLAALSVADDVLRSPPPPLVVRTPSEVEEAAVAGRRRSGSGRDDFQTPSAADLPYRPSPTGSSPATSASCLGGPHAGVGRVGLGPPVGFSPLFTLEFSQQKKKISGHDVKRRPQMGDLMLL